VGGVRKRESTSRRNGKREDVWEKGGKKKSRMGYGGVMGVERPKRHQKKQKNHTPLKRGGVDVERGWRGGRGIKGKGELFLIQGKIGEKLKGGKVEMEAKVQLTGKVRC